MTSWSISALSISATQACLVQLPNSARRMRILFLLAVTPWLLMLFVNPGFIKSQHFMRSTGAKAGRGADEADGRDRKSLRYSPNKRSFVEILASKGRAGCVLSIDSAAVLHLQINIVFERSKSCTARRRRNSKHLGCDYQAQEAMQSPIDSLGGGKGRPSCLYFVELI